MSGLIITPGTPAIPPEVRCWVMTRAFQLLGFPPLDISLKQCVSGTYVMLNTQGLEFAAEISPRKDLDLLEDCRRYMARVLSGEATVEELQRYWNEAMPPEAFDYLSVKILAKGIAIPAMPKVTELLSAR